MCVCVFVDCMYMAYRVGVCLCVGDGGQHVLMGETGFMRRGKEQGGITWRVNRR